MTSTTEEFDRNDIKNYTSKDNDYYRIYMKERYKTVTCKKVHCDVCGKLVMYGAKARHKKSLKCMNSAEGYKLSVEERLQSLEKIVKQFNIDMNNLD